MNTTRLPARIVYAIVALPLGAVAGFYATVWLWPELALYMYGAGANVRDYDTFTVAMAVGAALAFTACLVALTLPWKRHRRRSGRAGRVAVSSVFVILVSLAFAGWGQHALVYDLAFAAWLAYVMAFTFVRYGVRDRAKRAAAPDGSSSSTSYVD